jgi:hypothetical protein
MAGKLSPGDFGLLQQYLPLADISPVVRTVKYQTCRFRNLDSSVSMVQPAKDRMRAERSVLCLKSALRLERRDQQGQEEA